MEWTELFFSAVILVLVIGTITFLDLYRRRRCRKCGRAWAVERVLGARRSGYVRFRCKYCGAEQRKVIEDDDMPFAP